MASNRSKSNLVTDTLKKKSTHSLYVQKEKYEEIKAAADRSRESVKCDIKNGYRAANEMCTVYIPAAYRQGSQTLTAAIIVPHAACFQSGKSPHLKDYPAPGGLGICRLSFFIFKCLLFRQY